MHTQHTTPLLVDIDGYRNVTELLTRRAEEAPQHIAFEVPAESGDLAEPWRPISTQDFLVDVSQLAKGFIAAGVKEGDAIAIMAETRYEWALVDLAAWFAGPSLCQFTAQLHLLRLPRFFATQKYKLLWEAAPIK